MRLGLSRLSAALVALLLLVAVPDAVIAQQTPAPVALTSAPTAQELDQAKLDGQTAAANVGGWFGRSFTIGLLTGPIGAIVTYAVAANSTPRLPPEQRLLLAEKPEAIRVQYEQGYADTVRARRKLTALRGGLVGAAILVVVGFSFAG